MNKKGISMLMIAVIVVVVVVAGIAVYYMLSSGGGDETPVTVADATSLQFEANVTSQGVTIPYKFAGKNMGTENLMIKIDVIGGEAGNYYYILRASDQNAWANVDGTWTDVSSDFLAQWDSWGTEWTNHVDNLADWSGTGDWSYTAPNGDSITIFNISVNPELSDSLFQPS